MYVQTCVNATTQNKEKVVDTELRTQVDRHLNTTTGETGWHIVQDNSNFLSVRTNRTQETGIVFKAVVVGCTDSITAHYLTNKNITVPTAKP